MIGWTVAGHATRLPATPGWRAVIVQHDAEGRPVESSPGRTAIQIVPVAHWILALGLRLSPPEESAVLTLGAAVQTSTALYPAPENGTRLDTVKGFKGLSVPGETDLEALARLVPEAAPIVPALSAADLALPFVCAQLIPCPWDGEDAAVVDFATGPTAVSATPSTPGACFATAVLVGIERFAIASASPGPRADGRAVHGDRYRGPQTALYRCSRCCGEFIVPLPDNVPVTESVTP